ncbi:hypothetical protein ECP02989422_4900 [Escherichia coli P0298942.2]|nr:hypothetical protein EC2845350_5183 [Escherichia coli 2845350]ENA08430.1 hypothetical protein ECP02989421_5085 [Escherichia coli P0298942.1]ENB46893.1 hypothetical protein ECP029894211_3302 [Escherichia coli P0298942.11]ENB48257.1 hypothetical protein ECP029894210_4934 [Escherichia coli P0298942.10]ENB49551.1 hypothetical protein ECP029894212_5292 [Escherichia coli P0298942.12]ENB68379.1 hypothetical protein ECP029894215_5348 [Escherichia coli P0298942.15]ENB69038.1 hypothetical protein EC
MGFNNASEGAFSYQEQNRHFSDSKEELQIQNDCWFAMSINKSQVMFAEIYHSGQGQFIIWQCQ